MNLPARYESQPDCARLIRILGLVGDKWSVLIIMILLEQPRRFNEIKRAAPGISQQMLTRALRGLERYGLASRTVRPTIPPQVTYALTSLGMSLAKVLQPLGTWVDQHVSEIEACEHAYLSKQSTYRE